MASQIRLMIGDGQLRERRAIAKDFPFHDSPYADHRVVAMARARDLLLTRKEAWGIPLSTVTGNSPLLKKRWQFQDRGPDAPNERDPNDNPGDEKVEGVAA